MSRSATIRQALAAVARATGADRDLDALIRDAVYGNESDDSPEYTASVDACLDLLRAVLPGWHWHVGHGASGVMPYASLSRDDDRFEAEAATVPLALLNVTLQALRKAGP